MAEEKPAETPVGKQGDEDADKAAGKPADKSEDKAVDTSPSGLLQSAVKAALPIVVSAVVSVGFVAFAGKAILWTRFEALNVPGDQVVKAVPQGEAVAVGASLLLIFGALGALAAIGVYLSDRGGRATALMSRSLLAILGLEAAVAIWSTHDKPLTSRIAATEVVLLAVATMAWATFVAGLTRERKVPGGAEEGGERKPPRGPFYRVETADSRPPKRSKSGNYPRPTSGISRRGLIVALVVAAALAAVAFLVAFAVGGVGWGAVSGLAALGVALGGAVLLHCLAFQRAERNKEDRARKEEEEEEKTEEEKRAERSRRPLARLSDRCRALCGGNDMAPAASTSEAPGDGKQPAKPAAEAEPKESGVELAFLGVVLVGALAALAVAVPPIVLREWWLAIALGAVVLLGAGLWRIASLSKERFVWYGLAVFISVPLFGTVMLMASNADEPKVQPMALIRETDGPGEAIQGLYVTEADQRVYFANVATEGCEKEVTPDSGRLLWVPTKEVVAMSVGPLQGVKEAGKAALEMSYDLTPAIETGNATIALSTDKEEAAGAEETAGAEGGGQEGVEGPEEGKPPDKTPGKTGDTRLENVGPAVRPNFGAGLRIEPEVVSPGDEATLRMSAPNEAVEGFGASRAGHNLRLGGKVVDIAKEKSGAAGAEYIETKSGRLIGLDKQGAYVREEDGDYVLAEGGDDGDDDNRGDGSGLYMRLDDPAILEVDPAPAGEEPVYVPIVETDGIAKVAPKAQEATLAGGTFEGRSWDGETVKLEGLPLLRQAWHEDHIKFHVPEDAKTSVVTVECDQLAGSPLLQVSRAPQARLAVQMHPGSAGVLLDSRSSSGSEGGVAGAAASSEESSNGGTEARVEAEPLTRRWKVDGVLVGHGKTIHQHLAPRMRPYEIELSVVDRSGNFDSAKLQVLRMPAVALRPTRNPFLRPRIRRAMRTAREAIEEAVEAERPTGVEIDGYTDSPGKAVANLKSSLGHDETTRERLLRDSDEASEAARPVRVEEFAHGETCPISKKGNRANLHVDVFLLHEGVIVKPTKTCRPHGETSATWHPPPGKIAG